MTAMAERYMDQLKKRILGLIIGESFRNACRH